MNTEEKAKAYDEALRKIRPLYERAKKEDCPIWSTYEYIFPELAESEDERIREEIISALKFANDGGVYDKHIAYLEKQKDEAQRQYALGVQAGREEAVYELEKERKPVEPIEFSNEFENQVSHLLASVLSGEHEYNEGFVKYAAQSLFGYAEKERKPNIELIKKSWYRAGYIDREFNKEPMWVLENLQYRENPKYGQDLEEQKPTEWSDDIIRKAVKEIGLTQHQIDWFKTNVFPPKQEWSKEDEDKIEKAIWLIQHYATDGHKKLLREEVISGLKSLRPHWKPSKEQLDALKEASASWMNQEMGNCELLESLYNDLLKIVGNEQ